MRTEILGGPGDGTMLDVPEGATTAQVTRYRELQVDELSALLYVLYPEMKFTPEVIQLRLHVLPSGKRIFLDPSLEGKSLW